MIKFKTKRTANIQRVKLRSFHFAVHTFIKTNDKIPRQIPSAIE